MASYPDFFCLYRVSLTRNQVNVHDVAGPSVIESRQNCSSLDCHISFAKATPTSLDLIVLCIYSDSFSILKDNNSDRSVILNYKL